MNPFGLLRWISDKVLYWVGWTIFFILVGSILRYMFGFVLEGTLLFLVTGVVSFWFTTMLMDFLEERLFLFQSSGFKEATEIKLVDIGEHTRKIASLDLSPSWARDQEGEDDGERK